MSIFSSDWFLQYLGISIKFVKKEERLKRDIDIFPSSHLSNADVQKLNKLIKE